ncbi:NAD(P)/FAD-dependent oxidoreductase [Chryseobacterium sp. R2A-55]|uniref:NAD(P)/FAD-dependent oxidoreductase n=1 Tax=Chryseobacterium sp. R2A-55 TaxID=2744445 RepID=UPI001F229235|nr:NAD(P)/FAD-dependent oxidoreductase [Chryseobacterium sp. R2A-55]
MKKKIAVIGGGFAGLQFAKHIDTKHYNVLLLDKSNHHQFQPLFYQVAAAQLEPSSISFPFRKIFQKREGVSIQMAEVNSVNPDEQTISTDAGKFGYDYLVIATGCKTNYFGNSELEKSALPLKSTFEAIQIRNRVLRNFERINSTKDYDSGLNNIVIVGAGPTGVELAGAFAEMKKNILPNDYPEIDTSEIRIILVEGSGKTLGNMSELAQTASLEYLKKLGVEVLLNQLVDRYENGNLILKDGCSIKSENVIWAAGVTGNIVEGFSKEIIQGNRYLVDDFNKISGFENIYAVGDIAMQKSEKYPKGHPQIANVAINQAKNLAENFNNSIKGKTWKPFLYKDQGSMATVGKYKAAVDLPLFSFKGFFAWVFWMFLHLMLILSVRNKLIVFINWMWTFFTNDSSLRLIIAEKASLKVEKPQWIYQ